MGVLSGIPIIGGIADSVEDQLKGTRKKATNTKGTVDKVTGRAASSFNPGSGE